MSEANKALAKRWFEEVWNHGRRETIRELLAPDAVIQDGEAAKVGKAGNAWMIHTAGTRKSGGVSKSTTRRTGWDGRSIAEDTIRVRASLQKWTSTKCWRNSAKNVNGSSRRSKCWNGSLVAAVGAAAGHRSG
jgi:hypothetical protein